MKHMQTATIGPISVAVATREQALTCVTALIDEHIPRRIVAFCNAHTVNLARRDALFAAALDRALVLNDGIGLDIGRRILHGARFPTNLNGTDLTPAILGAAPRPLRLFLLGSPPGIAERAAMVLTAMFPQHVVVGTRDGFFAAEDGARIAGEIAETRADLVLAGMGQPRQEYWAADHAAATGALVLCIGAYLDFAAGAVQRAPDWVQTLRIEWVYRLVQEPRRLAGRYLLGNPQFLAGIAGDLIRRRLR